MRLGHHGSITAKHQVPALKPDFLVHLRNRKIVCVFTINMFTESVTVMGHTSAVPLRCIVQKKKMLSKQCLCTMLKCMWWNAWGKKGHLWVKGDSIVGLTWFMHLHKMQEKYDANFLGLQIHLNVWTRYCLPESVTIFKILNPALFLS